MKTTIKIYRNIRNSHKYIEIHNDGYYHNSVKQYMYFDEVNIKNELGDRCLHRWRKNNLIELLKDYSLTGTTIGGTRNVQSL